MQQLEDSRPGEAHLCDLSGQKTPPQQILTKEASTYTDATPSYGNDIYASWISRTWIV